MTNRRFGRTVSKEKLVQQVRELVRQEKIILKEKDINSHSEIAQHYQLSMKRTRLNPGQDGALADDTVVLNNDGRSEERQNFTFYHEVTHHLIRQNDDLLSQIHDAIQEPDSMIEILCNEGAAEFLVSQEDIDRAVEGADFSTEIIPVLCQRHIASALVIAFQMVTYARHHCYLVVSEPRPVTIPTAQLTLENSPLMTSNECLVVTYWSKSAEAKYSMSRGMEISYDHTIALAYKGQCRMVSLAKLPFRSGKPMQAECDAMYFRGKVYAFFNVTPPLDVSNQIRLF